MKHLHYTIYLSFTIATMSYFSVDPLSISTSVIGVLLLNYFFYICQIDRIPKFHAFQRCPTCKKMTPQHFIHCDICNKCVSVDKSHYDIINVCSTKFDYKRYIYLLRGMILLNCTLFVLMSISQGWYVVPFILFHLYFLKSTYKKNKENIYVRQ